MRTKTWVCQKLEWSACGPKHVHLPNWSACGPPRKWFIHKRALKSVFQSSAFICYIASVALIQPQITRKLFKNGGKWAKKQNKQEIIYLNEYLSDSSWMKGKIWLLKKVH